MSYFFSRDSWGFSRLLEASPGISRFLEASRCFSKASWGFNLVGISDILDWRQKRSLISKAVHTHTHCLFLALHFLLCFYLGRWLVSLLVLQVLSCTTGASLYSWCFLVLLVFFCSPGASLYPWCFLVSLVLACTLGIWSEFLRAIQRKFASIAAL